MRRLIQLFVYCALAIAVSTPASLASEGTTPAMEISVALLHERPAEIAATLGDHVQAHSGADGIVFLSYTGMTTPLPLISFLTTHFDDLSSYRFVPGAPVSLSLALVPHSEGTEARLLLQRVPDPAASDAHAQVFGKPMPQDATMILSENAGGRCGGQFVFQRALAAPEAARTYDAALEARGFATSATTDAEGTLILANGTPCSAIVFIQPDRTAPGRSTIVVRYLED